MARTKEDPYRYMSDEEREKCVAGEKAHRAERRRQSRTPHGVETTNRHKRNGNMSFSLTPSGRTFILSMTTNNAAGRLLLETLQKLSPKLVKRVNVGTNGKQQIEFPPPVEPEEILRLAGCKPVPEKCVRCAGHGALNLDGSPSWSIHLGGGGAKACPICKGSGKALPDPTDDAQEEP